VCDRRTSPARVGLGSLSSSVALHLPCFPIERKSWARTPTGANRVRRQSVETSVERIG
jgi:hypothetical protein